jgi:dihydroorotase
VLSGHFVTEAGQALVFRGVRAIDPGVGLDALSDVVVERGRIAAVGLGTEPARAPDARVIDGQGRWLLPAFVDQHVHLREPGDEHKETIESGLAAGAAGGFAHVCAMPNTRPVNDTRAVTELMLSRAARTLGAKLHPIGAITQGLEGKRLTDMGELAEAGIIAVSDDGRSVTSSAIMRRALEYATNFGLLLIQHAEDHELTANADMHEGAMSTRLGLRGWPRVAEDAIVARDVMLARYVGARYHVAHVSTAGSVELVRAAKARGDAVSCEVTPHHLLLTDATLADYDPVYKVNPPLREESDRAALVAALADGTIDSIATDHAPHAPPEKECELSEARSGMMGLELCFSLVLGLVREGKLSLSRLIDALSTRPSTILGLEPPRLRVGSLAELVLVDPEERWVPAKSPLKSKARNSPFLSQELTGRVLLTMAGGRVVFDRVEGRP